MSLYRIPLLLTTAVCSHKCSSPPNPTVSKDELRKQDNVLERVFMLDGSGGTVVLSVRIFIWSLILAECTVIPAQAAAIPRPMIGVVLLMLTGDSSGEETLTATLPTSLILGSALALVGTHVRLGAYRALGRHFTYQLTLRDDHRLITDYPYTVVRHPSYTGALLSATGLFLTLGTHDGWMRNVLIPAIMHPTTLPKLFALTFFGAGTLVLVFVLALVIPRAKAEDAMLKERFGKEWEEWAQRVPYKIIPYVW